MIRSKLTIGTPLSRTDMKNIIGGVAPAGELWNCTSPSGGTIQICHSGTANPGPDCGLSCDFSGGYCGSNYNGCGGTA